MRFTVVALTLSVLSAVSAITITKPDSSGWKNGTVTVEWTSASGDPSVFTIQLRDTNTPSVINPMAIANNVQTPLGTTSFELPIVPEVNTYVIEFINVTDVNQIYATSNTFGVVNVAQTASTTATTPAVTGTAASSSATSAVSTRSTASTSSTAAASATSAASNSALGMQVPALAGGVLAMLAALL
ncbi:unnamed protein product [Rhizoctonia solani]|uniref:Yeast cell wall synthesis Kre9/Knh1-like N-terminal domain-containing protein n=1 Tax=Rhizoctonia solani TaxID=456999 RepID=A0A8H3AQL4_9AGAM|nr:unnamed protein product [Rhizoctonia solani]CAE6510289.1 unnamed protein product [Rhizoctonia solani]